MLKTITAKIAEVAAVAARAVCAFIADNARPLLRGFARASAFIVMTAAVAGCGGGGAGFGASADCPRDINGYSVPDGGHYHTPLLSAVIGGDLNKVKFLVECGANINQEGGSDDAHGMPRDAAIILDHHEVAEFLKSKGGECRREC